MSVDTDFDISTTWDAAVPVVALSGEADVLTAPQIRDALFAVVARQANVVVDMSGLTFIDSSALGVLVVARKRFAGAGGGIRLHGLRPQVRRVFDITGLSDAFPILDDAAGAAPGGT